jgi:tetratricopeptide (TPR) repeat protein
MAKKASKLSSTALAELYGVELPERYRKFIDSGEYVRWNKRKLDRIPGHSKRGVELSFDSPRLAALFREHGVTAKAVRQIPLALPKGLELCALTLDVSKPACPVGVWDEGSFVSFLPSLDALLAALDGKLEAPPEERLEKAVDEAHPLYKADKFAKALAILDPAIGDLVPSGKDDKVDRWLSKAENLRGLCYDHLEKPKEAIERFEAGMKCGTEQADYAALNFLRLHLKQGNFDVVIETASKLAKKDLGDACDFYVAKYLGLAQLRSGEDAAAKKTLLGVAKRWKKDAERTKNLVESLEELKKEHPLAGKLLEQVGKK